MALDLTFLADSQRQPDTQTQYREHLEWLARVLEVQVKITSNDPRGWRYVDGVYNSENHTVQIVCPDGELQYWTTMHELGHAFYRHFRTYQDYYVGSPKILQQEYEAWVWALNHAISSPSESANRFMDHALGTYERGLQRRRPVEPPTWVLEDDNAERR